MWPFSFQKGVKSQVGSACHVFSRRWLMLAYILLFASYGLFLRLIDDWSVMLRQQKIRRFYVL